MISTAATSRTGHRAARAGVAGLGGQGRPVDREHRGADPRPVVLPGQQLSPAGPLRIRMPQHLDHRAGQVPGGHRPGTRRRPDRSPGGRDRAGRRREADPRRPPAHHWPAPPATRCRSSPVRGAGPRTRRRSRAAPPSPGPGRCPAACTTPGVAGGPGRRPPPPAHRPRRGSPGPRPAAHRGPCGVRPSAPGRPAGGRSVATAGAVGGPGEVGDPETVGDDHRIATEVLDHHQPGRLRNRDAGVELLDRRSQHAAGQLHGSRPGRGRVEGGDDRLIGRPQGQQRDARRHRLVQVQQVERVLAEPAPDPGGAQRSEVHPSHGSVVAHRNRGPGGGEAIRARAPRRPARSAPRGEHVRVVAAFAQVAGQAQDVGSARRPGSRRSTDRPARSAAAARQASSRLRGRHGLGRRRTAASCASPRAGRQWCAAKKSATSWVMATRPSRPGRAGTTSPKTIDIPSR